MVIVGLESIPISNPEHYEGKLLAHIRKCYTNPMILGAKLVVFIEGNLANEAYHVKKFIVKYYPNASFPGTMGSEKPGVLATEESKKLMAKVFATALWDETVRIEKDFVTSDPKVLDMARTQLTQYSREVIVAKDPFHENKIKYTGKGRSMADKDDLAIVIQMGAWCVQRFHWDHDRGTKPGQSCYRFTGT
jgi:hypothetical protein